MGRYVAQRACMEMVDPHEGEPSEIIVRVRTMTEEEKLLYGHGQYYAEWRDIRGAPCGWPVYRVGRARYRESVKNSSRSGIGTA